MFYCIAMLIPCKQHHTTSYHSTRGTTHQHRFPLSAYFLCVFTQWPQYVVTQWAHVKRGWSAQAKELFILKTGDVNICLVKYFKLLNKVQIKCTWYRGSSARETDTASVVCICTLKVLFSGRGFKKLPVTASFRQNPRKASSPLMKYGSSL